MTIRLPQEAEYRRSRERGFVASDSLSQGVPEYDPFRDRHLERWFSRREQQKSTRRRGSPAGSHGRSPSTPLLTSIEHPRTASTWSAPQTPLPSFPPTIGTPQRSMRTHGDRRRTSSDSPSCRSPQLQPLAEVSPQSVPCCKQHPEEPASVMSEKFGFLCFQCDMFLHRTWRTSNLKRIPIHELTHKKRAVKEGSRGTELLHGDAALAQLLAMEARPRHSRKARIINGEFVASYSHAYRERRGKEILREEQALALGSVGAVTKLQAWVRGANARIEVKRLREALYFERDREKAVIKIQGLARGKQARAVTRGLLLSLRAEEEAIKIQTISRGRLAREHDKSKKAAVLVLQRAWRGHSVRKQIACGKESAASILIQAAFRGSKTRQHRKEEHQAAGQLQRIHRGTTSRRQTQIRAGHKKRDVSRKKAAVVIQKSFRGFKARRNLPGRRNMWTEAAKMALQEDLPVSQLTAGLVDDFPWEVLGTLHLKDLRYRDRLEELEREKATTDQRLQQSIKSALGAKEAELDFLKAEMKMKLADKQEEKVLQQDAGTKALMAKQQEDFLTMQAGYKKSQFELQERLAQSEKSNLQSSKQVAELLEQQKQDQTREQKEDQMDMVDKKSLIDEHEAERARLLMEVGFLRRTSEKAMLTAVRSTKSASGGTNWSDRRKRLEDWKAQVLAASAEQFHD